MARITFVEDLSLTLNTHIGWLTTVSNSKSVEMQHVWLQLSLTLTCTYSHMGTHTHTHTETVKKKVFNIKSRMRGAEAFVCRA